MEAETVKKKSEVVISLLKEAELEQANRIQGPSHALDLSGQANHKALVRSVVESFLLSTDPNTDLTRDGDSLICYLSNKRSVVVQDYKGKSFVSIRDFYRKDGKQLPSAKGISLTTEQWSAFKKSIPAIEEAVMKMQSKLRSAVDGDQTDLSQSVTASTHELVPIEINHFDGKNYHSWAAQMEFFLKQLKVAYALADACQCVNFSPVASTKEIAEAKAAQQKWINDDYICHHNIMSCLSDHLYVQYSKKTKSAKELWEN